MIPIIVKEDDDRSWALSRSAIDGSEPMQNYQAYFFSDILKNYNIVKIIIWDYKYCKIL